LRDMQRSEPGTKN